ncbi:MAG: 7-cyano-7-deazaguanine synthase QueC [Chlamydiia bacterium]|nr:7-cyano-7-deazaguanine synthase QueC [Chlamydiia bacterium]
MEACVSQAALPKKQAIVVHSGGMDSSICLAEACRLYGPDSVLSLSFSYGQRHAEELLRARAIAEAFGASHVVLDISCLRQITRNALTEHSLDISHEAGEAPNTLVEGRNGLMARLAAIHAKSLGAHVIYMGVIEVEEANSGYRDCSRLYMDKMQDILRMDLGLPDFEIRTPLVKMTKAQTMAYADALGVLPFLLETSISCYRGIPGAGCRDCPACVLRNEGIRTYLTQHPELRTQVSWVSDI